MRRVLATLVAILLPIGLGALSVIVLGHDIAALGNDNRAPAAAHRQGVRSPLPRRGAGALVLRASAFPSSTCRFAVPADWPVVWSDLDRGIAWHSEARPPSMPLAHIGCDVLHQSAPAPVAARAARVDGQLMPGYRELGFGPKRIGTTPGWEWRFEHLVGTKRVDVTRLYLPAGAMLELQAPAGGDPRLTAAFAEAVASFGGHSTSPAKPTAATSLTPADGSIVAVPPTLTWPARKDATYYNVQLFDGTVQIDEAWPKKPGHRLDARALQPGQTYTWYVWAASGAASAPRFGDPIGRASFTYRP